MKTVATGVATADSQDFRLSFNPSGSTPGHPPPLHRFVSLQRARIRVFAAASSARSSLQHRPTGVKNFFRIGSSAPLLETLKAHISATKAVLVPAARKRSRAPSVLSVTVWIPFHTPVRAPAAPSRACGAHRTSTPSSHGVLRRWSRLTLAGEPARP